MKLIQALPIIIICLLACQCKWPNYHAASLLVEVDEFQVYGDVTSITISSYISPEAIQDLDLAEITFFYPSEYKGR